MQASDIILWVSTGSSLIVAGGGLGLTLRNAKLARANTKLSETQSDTQVVTAEQLKAEVKRLNEEGNIWRDLRILDLEKWGDAMRPYMSARDRRDDQMYAMILEDRARCGLPAPDLVPLPPAPPYPEPRPRPT